MAPFSSITILFAYLGAATALTCTKQAFTGLLPSNAALTRINSLAAGSTYGQPFALDPEFPAPASDLPQLCAVDIEVTTAGNSTFHFGLFLPTDSAWNGRFLMTGNGGFGGGINVSRPFDPIHRLIQVSCIALNTFLMGSVVD